VLSAIRRGEEVPRPAVGSSSNIGWLESLSPWPAEFGLGRMRALLAELGEPQRAYPAIHVVGSNGKSTATVTAAALLAHEGLRVGAYLSPHVSGWAERVRIDGEEADFEALVEAVRPAAERLGATQFEALTAAAFCGFAQAAVEVAVVEAGLGGRLDATNVVDAEVVLLTNVALEHTDVLGDTLEQIAAEKLAVAHAAAVVVLPDGGFAQLVPHARVVLGGAREAAEACLGRPIGWEVEVSLPGRLEVRGERPFELWDGAHNPAAVDYLVDRLERDDFVLVLSILADKDVEQMLRAFARAGARLVATGSPNERALPATELARRADGLGVFDEIELAPDPGQALELALTRAGEDGAVLVSGSLYLLAALAEADS
jgi:dihydrofolate synthase / folylpolyglutamate synthase